MKESLFNIFEEAQLSKRSHKSLAKKFISICAHDEEETIHDFLHCILDQTLLHPKSSADIHRLIAFSASCLINVSDDLKVTVFQHLFLRLKSTVKHVRQRVCLLLEQFLDIASETSAELDVSLLQDISTQLIVRLNDKVPVVRATAVQALSHLQDGHEKNDPAIVALTNLLSIESAVTVRAAILKSLVWCDATINIFTRYLRDVSHEVRLCVISRFTESADIRWFSRVARTEIAHSILQDRNAIVRFAGEKLLLTWLSSLKNDVPKFISLFSPLENEQNTFLIAFWLAEKVLSDNSGTFNDLQYMTAEWKNGLAALSPAEVMWTVARCHYKEKYTSKFSASQLFTVVLPPSDFLCKVLSEIDIPTLNQNRAMQFNLKSLISLIPFYDNLVSNSSNGSEGLETVKILHQFTELLSNLQLNHDIYESLLESVSQLKTVQRGLTLENLLSKLWQMHLGCSDEDEEERDRITCQLLLLIKELLKTKGLDAVKMNKCFEFTLNCLQQPNAVLRSFAIGNLAMFCMFDDDIRDKYIRVIKQIAVGEIEDERVQMEAIKGLTDVCLTVSTDFKPEEKAEIDSALLHQMQMTSSEEVYDELNLLALECAIKLVFNGFSKDPALVSKFLQFFFIDASEITATTSVNIVRMNQLLSIFLHSFLLTEENCFEIVRESLPLFISDCVIAMKDERLDVNCLGKILENLFGICREVLLAINNTGKENHSLLDSYFLLSKTAFACLCCELLKLGNEENDKAMYKDFVKQLHTLGVSWCSKGEVNAALAVIHSVKESSAKDKVSDKLLVKLEDSLNECRDSTVASVLSVIDCAPALKELVQITSNNWEETSFVGKKRTRTNRPQRKVVEPSSSESEEEDSVDSDDYTEDDDEQSVHEKVKQTTGRKSQSKRNEEQLYFEEI